MVTEEHFAIDWPEPPATPIIKAHEKFDPPHFRVYLASALTGRSPDQAAVDSQARHRIRSVLEGYDLFGLTCEVYDPAEHTQPGSDHSPAEVYEIDYSNTVSADLVVFFCNAPSHGTGLEAQIAADACVPRVIVRPRDVEVSRMMLGTFNPTLCDIQYANLDDLETQLRAEVGNILLELYEFTAGRRRAFSRVCAIQIPGFIFTQRVFRNISLDELAYRTGIQSRWLLQLERDTERRLTLTLIQLELIADILDAELTVGADGKIRMVIKNHERCCDELVRESLFSLYDFVLESEGGFSDETIRDEWNRYMVDEVLPVQDAARDKLVRMGVADWRKRFEQRRLF